MIRCSSNCPCLPIIARMFILESSLHAIVHLVNSSYPTGYHASNWRRFNVLVLRSRLKHSVRIDFGFQNPRPWWYFRVLMLTLSYGWTTSREIRLSINGRMYTASTRSVLLCEAESWALRAGAERYRCLHSIGKIRWGNFVSNSVVFRTGAK